MDHRNITCKKKKQHRKKKKKKRIRRRRRKQQCRTAAERRSATKRASQGNMVESKGGCRKAWTGARCSVEECKHARRTNKQTNN